MQLDPNPFFRKVILPWYDSDASCWLMIVLMLAVLLFAVAGLAEAQHISAYHDHRWVPLLLLILSAAVVVSTAVRLIKRHIRRSSR